MIRDLPQSQQRTPLRHATECHMNKPRRKAASGGWCLHDDRPPTFRGWISTDEGEIGRREWRGRTEIVDVHALDGSPRPFGDYQVTSSNGSSYTVEIRSLGTHINSCGCRDHRTNRLGTCKHIEGVLHHLRGNRAAPPRRRKPKGQESSGRIEIFLDERDDRAVRMTVPEAIERADPAFVQEAGRHYRSLRRDSRKAFDALRDMARAHPERLRCSRSLKTWIDARKAPVRRRRERARFEAALEAGRRSFGFLKHPLLPYQVEGALHLTFGERVLLADDMGLGKTVQAIAACALLRELRGVERVLVVSPASLKAEWEEQIAKFSDLPSTIVFGSHPARCAAYRRHTFFTLCNYEQVVADGKVLLDALRPDVVILDEAQRIKNWQTKTANAVKKLQSRYAFVLTGTPLENRIDEIYSIVQFLDSDLLGPLFRFNREFYELDTKGKPSGFRNLDELARRVSSVMLRRRKEDVESELPGRTVKTFFVPMTDAQTRACARASFRPRGGWRRAHSPPLPSSTISRNACWACTPPPWRRRFLMQRQKFSRSESTLTMPITKQCRRCACSGESHPERLKWSQVCNSQSRLQRRYQVGSRPHSTTAQHPIPHLQERSGPSQGQLRLYPSAHRTRVRTGRRSLPPRHGVRSESDRRCRQCPC